MLDIARFHFLNQVGHWYIDFPYPPNEYDVKEAKSWIESMQRDYKKYSNRVWVEYFDSKGESGEGMGRLIEGMKVG